MEENGLRTGHIPLPFHVCYREGSCSCVFSFVSASGVGHMVVQRRWHGPAPLVGGLSTSIFWAECEAVERLTSRSMSMWLACLMCYSMNFSHGFHSFVAKGTATLLVLGSNAPAYARFERACYWILLGTDRLWFPLSILTWDVFEGHGGRVPMAGPPSGPPQVHLYATGRRTGWAPGFDPSPCMSYIYIIYIYSL